MEARTNICEVLPYVVAPVVGIGLPLLIGACVVAHFQATEAAWIAGGMPPGSEVWGMYTGTAAMLVGFGVPMALALSVTLTRYVFAVAVSLLRAA